MIIFAIPVPEESSFESKTGLKPVLMRVADYLFDSTTRSFYPHQIWPLDRVWYVEKSSSVNSRGMFRIEMLIHTLIESDYLSKEDLSCSCSHLALSKKAGPLPLSVVLIDNFYPGRTFDAFDYYNKIHENQKKISKTIKTKKISFQLFLILIFVYLFVFLITSIIYIMFNVGSCFLRFLFLFMRD